MIVTADVKKCRTWLTKSSRRKLSKAIVSHRRANRRAEKQALSCGKTDYRRRSYTGWDVI